MRIPTFCLLVRETTAYTFSSTHTLHTVIPHVQYPTESHSPTLITYYKLGHPVHVHITCFRILEWICV